MIRRFGTEFRILLLLLDAALAVVVLAVAQAVFPWESPAPPGYLPRGALFAAIYPLAWVALLWFHGLYRPRARWSLRSDVRRILQATAWMAFGTLALVVFLELVDIGRLFLALLFPVQAAVTVLVRGILRFAFRIARERGRNLRNVLVLGTAPSAARFAKQLEDHPELGLRVEGFLGDPAGVPSERWPYLGGVDRLEQILHERVIDEVVVCLPPEQWHLIDGIAGLVESMGRITRVPLQLPSVRISTGQLEELDGTPVLSLMPGPDRAIGLALKRSVDMTCSAFGLVVLSPLFLAVALAILFQEGRPILFRQERAGLHGRRFRIVKFRTMERDADGRRAELRAFNEVTGNASFKMTNDPRVTRLGLLLRRTSIDELPQLWNVLRGEMSLVGPRPHPLDDVAGYHGWHWRRLSMKPGITGLWQIGARRETDFDRWVEKDLEYIDGWSLGLDLRVLLRTIPALLRAEGR